MGKKKKQYRKEKQIIVTDLDFLLEQGAQIAIGEYRLIYRPEQSPDDLSWGYAIVDKLGNYVYHSFHLKYVIARLVKLIGGESENDTIPF